MKENVRQGTELTASSREAGGNEETIQLPPKATRGKSAAREVGGVEETVRLPQRATKQKHSRQERGKAGVTVPLSRKTTQPVQGLFASTLKLTFSRKDARASFERDILESLDEMGQDDLDDELLEHHGTWEVRPTTYNIPAVSPPPARVQDRPRWVTALIGQRSVRSLAWLSMLIVVALLLSGAFGIVTSFGRTVQKVAQNPPPALLASPTTITLGGIVTLRGTHFTPGGDVILSRDAHIPVVDTGGLSTIQVDASGLFSDTVVVDPIWLSGTHTLYVVDVSTHKQASLPLLVTGQNALQGPPHLVLSSSTLDLGSGDETTSANKLLAISDAGDGVVTWQASASQSWLQITPQSGSVASGKHLSVVVAASRANLAPGSYQATIVFSSNAGPITLPVTLTVTAIQPRHEAILQLSRATLAFNGTVGSGTPGAQSVVIYNPGILPLTWGANVSSSGWLWASPTGGTIAPGGAERVTIGTQTNNLGSGLYKGALTFSNQGSQPVQGSPQSVYVSLTMTPACTLSLSHGSLSFTGQHNAASPAGKSLGISVAKGCSTGQNWTVAVSTASGGNWLRVSSSSGTIPATVTVSAHTSGLAAGTYNGTLSFTTDVGTKILNVTLTITPVPCTISGPSSVTMQGNAGQSSLVAQGITFTDAGDCQNTLDWTSSLSGGSWLNATASGTFTSSGSATIRADLSGLSAGTYSGTVTITVVDSVTGQTVGVLPVSVTLTALTPPPPPPPCTVQAPSTGSLNFNANVGANPAASTASFTLGVTGSCSGNVTITPGVGSASSNWLAITGPVTIASGSTAGFTVTITSSTLSSGTYTATITLAASGGISGSPQSVTVTLTVQ